MDTWEDYWRVSFRSTRREEVVKGLKCSSRLIFSAGLQWASSELHSLIALFSLCLSQNPNTSKTRSCFVFVFCCSVLLYGCFLIVSSSPSHFAFSRHQQWVVVKSMQEMSVFKTLIASRTPTALVVLSKLCTSILLLFIALTLFKTWKWESVTRIEIDWIVSLLFVVVSQQSHYSTHNVSFGTLHSMYSSCFLVSFFFSFLFFSKMH